MERPNPSVGGLYSGLHGNGSVENLATEEEGLRLLAGAASARSGSGAGRGGGESEGRSGPFNGIVTEPDPEEGTSSGQRGGINGQRGTKRKMENEGKDFLKELTLSLMSRRHHESVWWADLEDEFKNGEMNLLYKYTFEQVKTHWLEDWEDFELALNTFAKVALRPDTIYTIKKTVNIRKCAYVLGNGAVVRFQTCDRIAFNCAMQSLGPGLIGMSGVTFMNVRFVVEGFNGTVFACTTQLTLHGVFFQNCSGICVDSWGRVSARGCTFVSCWKGVVG